MSVRPLGARLVKVHFLEYSFVLDIYILPTIKEYMSVEFIYLYWIYCANNWGIYVSWRVSVRPSGAGLGNVHFLKNKFVLDIYLSHIVMCCI